MTSKKRRIKKGGKTKHKVWMLFLILMLIISCIAYSSYESFSSLTASIRSLSKPNKKMILINDTFREIFDAENYIQTFIITGDKNMKEQYNKHVESCRSKMEELKIMFAKDSIQKQRVDSLQSLFETKLHYLNAFLKLKNQKEMSVFTNEALEEIQVQLNDSILTELQLRKRAYLNWSSQPVEKDEVIVIPDEYKGLNGFFRKLFGGDNTVFDTISVTRDELFVTQGIKVDTSIVKDYSPDSTLVHVKSILTSIIKKEKRMQQLLSQKELALLQQDQVFISNIKAIIGYLKRDEQIESARSNLYAQKIANQSIRFILMAGATGFIMSGIFLFFILRDTTRSNFYRAQLEKEKAHVEKLAKVKEEFLSNISHEIRTPLQSIQGFSELIGQTKLDDKQAEYIKAINHSNTYLAELINDILDQSKIEAGKLELAAEPFSLTAMLENLEVIFLQMALHKKIAFEVRTAEVLKGVYLIGDAVRIKQVLTNLLSNAIKFTTTGKVTFTIRATRLEQSMRLIMKVCDTGIGISKENKDSVFEQFIQEPSSTDANNSGTGLGLSIAKSLTEAMGGQISLKSTLNVGSVFTVLLKLPYKKINEQVLTHPAIEVAVKVPMNACIMIVEDDGWNATLLKEVLLQRVKKVQVFQNPIDALAFLAATPTAVDLIFTDIKMPQMDGSAFLKEVRLMQIDIPVIALTAHIQKKKLSMLQDEGFDMACSKPYQTTDIDKILQHYLPPVKTSKTSLKKRSYNLSGNTTTIANHSDFDFSIIWKFAENDKNTFQEMLVSLVSNNQQQLRNFKRFMEEESAENLAEISHQMKTTYDNLGLVGVSESLASIELHQQLGKPKKVLDCAIILYQEILDIHVKLKACNIKSQFRT